MMVFVTVIDAKSFTNAAEQLGISRARVSQIIARLENQLGTKLLHRTTRAISLTEQGRLYYAECSLIKDIAARANNDLSMIGDNLNGLIRVASPIGIEFITSALAKFIQRYPLIRIELFESDTFNSLIENGVDLAIRIGEMPDSNLYASKIGEYSDVLCASKEYLAQYPEVKQPEDLLKMNWVSHLSVHGNKQLKLRNSRHEIIQYNHPPIVSVSSIHSLKSLLLEHSGFGFIPSFSVTEEISSGALVPLLTSYHGYSVPIYAVYPERKMMPHSTSVLVNFLKETDFKLI